MSYMDGCSTTTQLQDSQATLPNFPLGRCPQSAMRNVIPRPLLGLFLLLLLAGSPHLAAQQAGYSFEKAQEFLRTYCATCHQGESPPGGFAAQHASTSESLLDDRLWTALNNRVER